MIDIIVTNYRTPGDLRMFLASLRCVTIPFTLTVVDVHPQEPAGPLEQSELAAIAGDPLFDHITTLTNCGYARACNQGALAGTQPAIAFFNADVAVLPGSVERCLETLMSNRKVAVVGPKQVDRAGRLTHAGIKAKGRHGCVQRAWHHRDRGQFDQMEILPSVAGSAYFVKREVWDEMRDCPLYREADPSSAGAFLQTQHYFEETWFSYHVRAHGYQVAYEGRAKMIHLWHRASPRRGGVDRQLKISQERFYEACDHHGIECRP